MAQSSKRISGILLDHINEAGSLFYILSGTYVQVSRTITTLALKMMYFPLFAILGALPLSTGKITFSMEDTIKEAYLIAII